MDDPISDGPIEDSWWGSPIKDRSRSRSRDRVPALAVEKNQSEAQVQTVKHKIKEDKPSKDTSALDRSRSPARGNNAAGVDRDLQ